MALEIEGKMISVIAWEPLGKTCTHDGNVKETFIADTKRGRFRMTHFLKEDRWTVKPLRN
jgi:hypothetical protein